MTLGYNAGCLVGCKPVRTSKFETWNVQFCFVLRTHLEHREGNACNVMVREVGIWMQLAKVSDNLFWYYQG